jgi:hypothetical protein
MNKKVRTKNKPRHHKMWTRNKPRQQRIRTQNKPKNKIWLPSKNSVVAEWCWWIAIGGTVLAELSLRNGVGGSLLEELCWGNCIGENVGGTVLVDFMLEYFVGGTVLVEQYWCGKFMWKDVGGKVFWWICVGDSFGRKVQHIPHCIPLKLVHQGHTFQLKVFQLHHSNIIFPQHHSTYTVTPTQFQLKCSINTFPPKPFNNTLPPTPFHQHCSSNTIHQHSSSCQTLFHSFHQHHSITTEYFAGNLIFVLRFVLGTPFLVPSFNSFGISFPQTCWKCPPF